MVVTQYQMITASYDLLRQEFGALNRQLNPPAPEFDPASIPYLRQLVSPLMALLQARVTLVSM